MDTVESTLGKIVVETPDSADVRIATDASALRITGPAEKLAVLADVVHDASEAVGVNGHVHVDHHDDHDYLEPSPVSLVVADAHWTPAAESTSTPSDGSATRASMWSTTSAGRSPTSTTFSDFGRGRRRKDEFMHAVAARLISAGLASAADIVGCSEEEVAELRADHGVTQLPEQYELFLRAMGRQAGPLLRGTDIFHPHIFGLDADGRELLAENKAEHLLAEGSVVIGIHQGYELYWLDPSGVLNRYQEPDQSVHRTWPTLVEFLTSQVDALSTRAER